MTTRTGRTAVLNSDHPITDVEEEDDDSSPSEEEDGPAQIYVRTTKSTVRAFKRLAERRGMTLSALVLDVMWNEVSGDIDELRKAIEEEKRKAQQQIEAEERMLAEIEQRNEVRMRKEAGLGKPR